MCKPLRNSHVHIEGIAYKRDIDDVRESPALDVIHLLQSRGARVTYFDPYIPKVQVHSVELSSTDVAAEADCVVIITDHRTTDYAALWRSRSSSWTHATRSKDCTVLKSFGFKRYSGRKRLELSCGRAWR